MYSRAHELGHIAGPRHEHEGSDAGFHIIVNYTCPLDAIKVYQAIDRKDQRHGSEAGDTITTTRSTTTPHLAVSR